MSPAHLLLSLLHLVGLEFVVFAGAEIASRQHAGAYQHQGKLATHAGHKKSSQRESMRRVIRSWGARIEKNQSGQAKLTLYM
jgi:hypothetical protein